MRCCAPFCRNAPDNVPASQQGRRISFHGFPSDARLRTAWLRALGKQSATLPDPAVVCSQHFLDDDIHETESGSSQIDAGAIPSTVLVCMMCLDTDGKMFLMSKHKLEKAYEYLTGCAPCNQGNLKQTLCVQCAQRLMNFSRFREQSLRARALMMDLVEKHELITRLHIKMINRTKHRLRSPMVVTTLGPDFCDLHIQADTTDDKHRELNTTIYRGVVRTEESNDSMAIREDMDMVYDDTCDRALQRKPENVDQVTNIQDLLKFESDDFECSLCSQEFDQELAYMEHMSKHAQVCMVCLDTDSKMFLTSKHKLEEAYEYLTGYVPCNQGNLKPTLCVQCAQTLMNFSRFRDQSLRARALMMALVEKHELITRLHIKMINRTKHRLRSPMVVTTLGPDFCDLHIQEDTSDKKHRELETTICRGVVKTEENNDSMAIREDMDMVYDDTCDRALQRKPENVDQVTKIQDLLKFESDDFECSLCSQEFDQELAYMEHMSKHAQITRRHIRTINLTKPRLKSPMVLQEDTSDDKQTELETNLDTGAVKTEESDNFMGSEEDIYVIIVRDDNADSANNEINEDDNDDQNVTIDFVALHEENVSYDSVMLDAKLLRKPTYAEDEVAKIQDLSGLAAGESGKTGACERRGGPSLPALAECKTRVRTRGGVRTRGDVRARGGRGGGGSGGYEAAAARGARGARTRGGRGAPAPSAADAKAGGADAAAGGGLNAERSGRGVGARRPLALDPLELHDIETFPQSPPIEVPLTKKRRPNWPPCSDAADAGPSCSAPAAGMSSDAADVAAVAGDVSPCLHPLHAMDVEGRADSSSVLVRSSHRNPGLQDTDMTYNLFLGSESEPESEDDEECVTSAFIPRAQRALIDTLLDEKDDAAAPQPVQDFQAPHSTDTAAAEIEAHSSSAEPEMGPSFYSFDWKAFPNPPLDPRLRREAFAESNVGPTTPCVDPYGIFIAIWDQTIMEHIVSETNEYARQLVELLRSKGSLRPKSRILEWRDTTTDELYTYLAIVLAMGCVTKSRIEAYWSPDQNIFCTPHFRTHMSLRRFQLLSRCLHFNRNDRLCEQNVTTSHEAKLFKVKPVVDHLNKKFPEMYKLRQNIALDESLLQWKGWLSFSQLIPNKAATIGIKTYEVCESQTGYLWRFEVHTRKSQQPPSLDPLEATTPAIVLRLLDGLQNKGHTVWMDNFYNSPALARKLKTLGFDSVGTLRTNRQFVPEDLRQLTKEIMRPGQITGRTSGDVDVLVWRDKNRVAALSTYHGHSVTARDGTTKPNLVLDYNIMMGGVDRKDQMLAAYPVERKRTKIWYKKFFRRLLNVSVLNAYIIYKQSSGRLEHYYFRQALILSLLKKYATNQAVESTPKTVSVQYHHLAELPFLPHKTQRQRRVCNLCKKRVQTYCVGCDKSVCMTPCFVKLHGF